MLDVKPMITVAFIFVCWLWMDWQTYSMPGWNWVLSPGPLRITFLLWYNAQRPVLAKPGSISCPLPRRLPCFLAPLPHPLSTSEPFPWLLPYPITHNPCMIFPLYLFRVFPIPTECRQYSWDNRGWLVGYLQMGIGNTLPLSWGKQLLPSFISSFLHKRHESVREQMNGQKEDWNGDSYFHYSPCLLSVQPFSGLRTRMRYPNPLGSQFVQFFICFSEEWEGSWGIRQQISFIVSKSHIREMLAQLRKLFLWLKE